MTCPCCKNVINTTVEENDFKVDLTAIGDVTYYEFTCNKCMFSTYIVF